MKARTNWRKAAPPFSEKRGLRQKNMQWRAAIAVFDARGRLQILKERYEKELRWQVGNPHREDLTLQLWMEMIEEDRTGSSRENKP